MILELEVLPEDVLKSLCSCEEEEKDETLRDFVVSLLIDNKNNELITEVCCLLFDHVLQTNNNEAEMIYKEVVDSYENNRNSW